MLPKLGVCLSLFVACQTSFAGLLDKVAENAKRKTAEADIQTIGNCLQMFKLNAGTYPTTEQGLEACVTKPTAQPIPRRWMQLLTKVPKDPWGNAYHYRYPGTKDPAKFEVFSSGKDGVAGTADDIQTPKPPAN